MGRHGLRRFRLLPKVGAEALHSGYRPIDTAAPYLDGGAVSGAIQGSGASIDASGARPESGLRCA
jgi:diketogulonate reductase-like aldo/keto reductase